MQTAPSLDQLLPLLVAVSLADGEVSDEEFQHLFHYVCRFAVPDEVRDVLRSFVQAVDPDTALRQAQAHVFGLKGLSYTDRLAIVAILWDYAAADSIHPTEVAVIGAFSEALSLHPGDVSALCSAVDGGPSRQGPGVSVVRVGGAGADFHLINGAGFSALRLGDRCFVRVCGGTSARLGEGYAPQRVLLEVDAAHPLVCPPYTFDPDELDQLLASTAASGEPIDSTGDVAVWRRGAFVLIEPLQAGHRVRERELALGVRYILDRGDKVTAPDGSLWLPPEVIQQQWSDLITAAGVPTGAAPQPAAAASPLRFQALHLHRAVVEIVDRKQGRRRLLDDVSFQLSAGEMVAVIGPSGSGKSTLLEVLSGRRLITGGELVVELGDGRLGGVAHVRDRCALVPQRDLLVGALTTRENVDFTARLRQPTMRAPAREALVSATVAQVGLKRWSALPVGDDLRRVLSGGQRRRAAIAQELVAQPEVLFLDEPLSGLSSRDASSVVSLLSDARRGGVMVVVVVHQPSLDVFRQFDKVIVLDIGGRLAFAGTPSDCLDYFSPRQAAEPAGPDIILDVMEQPVALSEPGTERRRLYPPVYWCELFALRNRTPQPTPDVAAAPSAAAEPVAAPHRLARLKTLLHRYFLIRLRNRMGLALSLLVAPALGVLLSLVLRWAPASDPYEVFSNRQLTTYLFMVPVVAVFLSLSGSCTEFVRERRWIRHEADRGLTVGPVLVAKVIVLAVFSAVEMVLFFAASLPILGHTWPVWPLIVFGWLSSMAGLAMGLFISSAVSSSRAAYAMVPLILIPQLVFGGALIEYPDMGRAIYADAALRETDGPWVSGLVPVRWAYEAIVVETAEAGPRCQILLAPSDLADLTVGSRAHRAQQPWENRGACDKVTAAEEGRQATGADHFLGRARTLAGRPVPTARYSAAVLALMAALLLALTAATLHRRTRPGR